MPRCSSLTFLSSPRFSFSYWFFFFCQKKATCLFHREILELTAVNQLLFFFYFFIFLSILPFRWPEFLDNTWRFITKKHLNVPAVCITTKLLCWGFKSLRCFVCGCCLSVCLRACDCCIALIISLWVTGRTNILLSLCPALAQAARCAASVMHLNSTNTMFAAEKRGLLFWLMSPWQLHNSWIVLAIHLSFANHNSGWVFEEGWWDGKSYGLPLSSAMSPAHTHTHTHTKTNPYRKCWRILVLIWEAEALWKLPVL